MITGRYEKEEPFPSFPELGKRAARASGRKDGGAFASAMLSLRLARALAFAGLERTRIATAGYRKKVPSEETGSRLARLSG